MCPENASARLRASIGADTAPLDRRGPFLDFSRDEAGEIGRRAPLRRDDGDAEIFVAPAQKPRLYRFFRNLGQAIDDRLRRILREGEPDPNAAIEGGALLLG